MPGIASMDFVTSDMLLLIVIGFIAQTIDGALGMAFGLISTSFMLAMGLPPAQASAAVHTAEIFTTGASAASHVYNRNVDWQMVWRLGAAGVLGAALGAWLLSNVDAGVARPYVSAYLLMIGVYILIKSANMAAAREAPTRWLSTIGFAAGFLDASGGGGWGPVTTSTLIGTGHSPRHSIGSVNATEFFVTAAASATFFIELGASPLAHLIALAIGGIAAAPFGGFVVRFIPPRLLMVLVGVLIIGLAVWQLARTFKFI